MCFIKMCENARICNIKKQMEYELTTVNIITIWFVFLGYSFLIIVWNRDVMYRITPSQALLSIINIS